jgi:MOSC domain-containing protein YiiM
MANPLEVCDECGFDSRRWRAHDADTFMGALGWWWRSALSGLDPADLTRRPAPSTWSILEYGVHSANATEALRRSLERVLAGDTWEATDRVNPPRVDASPVDEPCRADLPQVLDDIETSGSRLAAVAKATKAAGWRRTAEREGRPPVRADSILFHAVHDASHHLMDVARAISALGIGAVRSSQGASAQLAQINVSQGGVPKVPVERADVGHNGLVGDRQAERKHHGRPFQAICLWSTSAIEELKAAGHPVFAGAAGENFTVDGLDWMTLRAGSRLRIGSALVELSFPAVPCRKLTRWFSDGAFGRLSYEKNPEWARWYAWVREPGSVTTGDAVVAA